eukprot:2245350-Alexandrium_andersonii.AAC.1
MSSTWGPRVGLNMKTPLELRLNSTCDPSSLTSSIVFGLSAPQLLGLHSSPAARVPEQPFESSAAGTPWLRIESTAFTSSAENSAGAPHASSPCVPQTSSA